MNSSFLLLSSILLLFFGNLSQCQFEKGRSIRNVVLKSEECLPRKELIKVEVSSMSHYSPMMVEVLRCGGVADKITPILKKCVKNSSEILRFPVKDSYNPNHVVYEEIENHLTCKGQCIHDKSVCKGASSWNEKLCKCLCLVQKKCPKHFAWNPNKCRCVCDRTCNRRQELDPEECACTCKSKFYRRCSKRGRVPNEEDCLCLKPPVTLGVCSPCDCKK